MNNIESINDHPPDIPEFLEELSNYIVLMNQLRTGTSSHREVDDSITIHINMLAMFREIEYQGIKYI